MINSLMLTFLAPDSFHTPKQKAPVPSTAYNVPQPKALIARADPSSSSISDFVPPFSISFDSDFLAFPSVRENPNSAEMPPTKPKNAAAKTTTQIENAKCH
ncbi:hypothetical protein DOY81_004497 [Sarcophaga bullata]|nr:hypothetical protein DOY81_004497 [Sarcophaga bullata]